MFSTFTQGGGMRTLLVRADRIVSIRDESTGGCALCWEAGGAVACQTVDGTAEENLDRLKQEELAVMAEAEQLQRKVQQGYPILPVARGKVLR